MIYPISSINNKNNSLIFKGNLDKIQDEIERYHHRQNSYKETENKNSSNMIAGYAALLLTIFAACVTVGNAIKFHRGNATKQVTENVVSKDSLNVVKDTLNILK